MRYWIADTVLHLGWMFFGQECDCDHKPSFNRMARFFAKFEKDDWDEDGPATFRGKLLYFVGDHIINIGNRLY